MTAVAGLGCRSGATPADVMAAIEAALAGSALRLETLDALATGPGKRDEPALLETALQLGLPLRIVPDSALKEAGGRTLTVSEASLAATGVPSLSEAAALAAAGARSRLLGPRISVGGATCAIATDGAAS